MSNIPTQNVRCVTTMLCAEFQHKCVKRNNVRSVTTVKKVFFAGKWRQRKLCGIFKKVSSITNPGRGKKEKVRNVRSIPTGGWKNPAAGKCALNNNPC